MEIIALEQMLREMDKVDDKGNPIPFELEVVSCDLNRNKGGKRITYRNATLCRSTGANHKTYRHRNNTRNLITPGMSYPEAFHPILSTKFNGKEVSL